MGTLVGAVYAVERTGKVRRDIIRIGHCAEGDTWVMFAIFHMETPVALGLHSNRNSMLDRTTNGSDTGPASWWSHQLTWIKVRGSFGFAVGYKTPSAEHNENDIRNSGIQPALMRYLVTLPPDHKLRQNNPGYVYMLDLPHTLARIPVISAITALLIGFCRSTRRPYRGPGDPEWPRECSGLLILMLFLSPVTWIQHLPWLVPALYWIVGQL